MSNPRDTLVPLPPYMRGQKPRFVPAHWTVGGWPRSEDEIVQHLESLGYKGVALVDGEWLWSGEREEVTHG